MTDTTEVTYEIPELLAGDMIFKKFCDTYLEYYAPIAEYNSEVLVDSDSEWTPSKVAKKAKELASPEEGEPEQEIKSAVDKWEELLRQASVARQEAIKLTADHLGIVLAATAERDPEKEEQLKELREKGMKLGKTLHSMVEIGADKDVSDAITEFLSKYKLPAIGRESSHDFTATASGTATPKYRVSVTASDDDDNVVIAEDGFSKAQLAAQKGKLYPKGEHMTAEKLRAKWEEAGNSADNMYAVPSVSFTDDHGFTWVIEKKN